MTLGWACFLKNVCQGGDIFKKDLSNLIQTPTIHEAFIINARTITKVVKMPKSVCESTAEQETSGKFFAGSFVHQPQFFFTLFTEECLLEHANIQVTV